MADGPTSSISAVSDGRLIAETADRIAVPKVAPADSFVLHAPLELLARAELLEYVHAASRGRAVARVRWLGDKYDDAGEPVEEPAPLDARSIDEVARTLIDALAAGDLDDVDRAAQRLGETATPAELRRLVAPSIVASLAAAAHGSILLWLLPRVSARHGVTSALVREPARELARHPDWRIRWFESAGEPTSQSLLEALLDVPMVGLPGSDFIYPIMNQAEESGIAPKLLAGLTTEHIDVQQTRRELSRVAAWSMLQEPPDYAPYGWSHCLTMPQAVMGIAGDSDGHGVRDGVDGRVAAAVAATHVVGFRAALGQRALVPDYRPEPPSAGVFDEALANGPETAAAFAFHRPGDGLDALVADLASNAALHFDAHLVKYTLACFDAAAADPTQRRLYLAAAASLAGWWAQQPSDGFFT